MDFHLSSPVIVTVPEISNEEIFLFLSIRSDMLLSKTHPLHAQLPRRLDRINILNMPSLFLSQWLLVAVTDRRLRLLDVK